MTLEQYIDNINKRYKLGNATEHTFRGDLQTLLESLVPDIRATNEPKRQFCGAPDYILTKKDIPVGFIEAKDVGDKDLEGNKKTGNKEQFDRYKGSLNNLIFTDYLDFHLYRETNTQQTIGQMTTPVFDHPSKGGEYRIPNLNLEIVNKIAEKLGLTFTNEKTTSVFDHPSKGGEYRTPNLNLEIVNKIAEKLGLTFTNEKTTSVFDHPSKGGEHSPPSEGCGVVNNQPTKGEVVLKEIVTTINNISIIRNFVENLPHNPALNQLSKDKRKAGILSEVLFWQQVHKNKFHKIDFDRQRIIGNYIVDFYVKTLGLVIEIDGSSHDDKQEYDAERQAYLESFGLKVFRCTDIDVKKRIGEVMLELEQFILNEYGENTTPVFDHPSKGGEYRTPNLNLEIVNKIAEKLGLTFTNEKTTSVFDHPSKGGELGEFAPIDILDYIYAVLHSPAYREKYKEFLKIDFPRVPYPKDKDTFWQLVKLGGEIRQIHLLENPTVEKYITQYPIDGNNLVGKTKYQDGKVYINDTQYFDNVPQIAWDFFIGGYQPAQKWLKDRKERTLEFDDILHYQKIIVALSETDKLMNEINKIDIE